MNPETPQPKKPLKESLFKCIEEGKVCPRSRWFFYGQECMVWFLWLASVLVGALAVAISMFVMTHHQYALYEATHENFLTFIVEVLPYIWIIVFGLMVYVAFYNLQHTKRGYRYPVSVILASSLVLSFAGGSALQFFGFGYKIDNILGYHMSMYMSQDKLERKMWQAPKDGRLVGRQVAKTVASTTIIIFEDMTGNRWQMNISELSSLDMDHLASGQTVRLLGETTNQEYKIFHACGAFPWMVDVSMDEMNQERKVFVDQLYAHMRKEKERLIQIEKQKKEDLPQTLPVIDSSVCANIAAARRMPVHLY